MLETRFLQERPFSSSTTNLDTIHYRAHPTADRAYKNKTYNFQKEDPKSNEATSIKTNKEKQRKKEKEGWPLL